MQVSATAYIGLGANLGDPLQTIQAAIIALDTLSLTEVTNKSSLYRTQPIEADGDDFINAVVELQTRQSPAEILNALQNIERQFGRVRSYQNAPRSLDCDLLLYDQQIIDTPDLIVPHPRMHQRAFVLIPLVEIAPEIHIPTIGLAKPLLSGLKLQAICKIS
jgi:2-amino-4-hydroxy-6-hydroxymethyldihydropteridine diphosphokinase